MRGSVLQGSAVVRYPRRNVLAIGLLLLVTALALIALFKLVTLDSSSAQTSSFVTLSGRFTCLPHKDTDGPTTLECALGLKGDDGRYYALVDAPASAFQEDFNKQVKVRGLLFEPDSNSQYAISGSLTVKSVTK